MFHLTTSQISKPKILAGSWIEPNCVSQVFRLDVYRLLTILNPASNVNSNIFNSNCIKIFTRNGNLIANDCDINNNNNVNVNNGQKSTNVEDQDSWLYQVRLASNCFEQNLVAYPSYDPVHYNWERSENYNHRTDNFWPVIYLVTRLIEPGEELSFWPWFGLSLMLGIPPFLSPINILNDHCYICHQCGHCYQQPNPLKIHLVLACSKRIIESRSESTCQHNPINHNVTDISNKNKSIKSIRDQNSIQQLIRNPKVDRVDSLPRRLHICSYCGKAYTRKYGLKIHIRTHTGIKPLSCRYCGRSFSDPSNLNKHMRLHTQHLVSTMATRRTVLSTGKDCTPATFRQRFVKYQNKQFRQSTNRTVS